MITEHMTVSEWMMHSLDGDLDACFFIGNQRYYAKTPGRFRENLPVKKILCRSDELQRESDKPKLGNVRYLRRILSGVIAGKNAARYSIEKIPELLGDRRQEDLILGYKIFLDDAGEINWMNGIENADDGFVFGFVRAVRRQYERERKNLDDVRMKRAMEAAA